MTDDLADAKRAFADHEAYEATEDGFRVTTTAFEGRVALAEGEQWRTAYEVTVRVPTLSAATADEVGEAVVEGWFDTLERRLEDAPQATRVLVDLSGFDVDREDGEVIVTYAFELGGASEATTVAKALVEYVEGTYVEGIVPGYDYVGTVADLVSQATSGEGQGQAGGTPL